MTKGILGTRRFTEEEVAMCIRVGDFSFWAVKLAFVSGLSVPGCADAIRNETSSKGDSQRAAKRLVRKAEKAKWKSERRREYDK